MHSLTSSKNQTPVGPLNKQQYILLYHHNYRRPDHLWKSARCVGRLAPVLSPFSSELETGRSIQPSTTHTTVKLPMAAPPHAPSPTAQQTHQQHRSIPTMNTSNTVAHRETTTTTTSNNYKSNQVSLAPPALPHRPQLYPPRVSTGTLPPAATERPAICRTPTERILHEPPAQPRGGACLEVFPFRRRRWHANAAKERRGGGGLG